MRDFGKHLTECGKTIIKDEVLSLQMNLGYACNLSCSHCHLQAGPQRTEMMTREVIDDCLAFAKRAAVRIVDITGGAPELNPHLHHLIEGLQTVGTVGKIILRSNLTLLSEEEYVDLPYFLAANGVEIVASLPCYMEENVKAQRGDGVYAKTIETLQKLNRIGFGSGRRRLDLVYNPGGGFLPPPQPALEAAYKEHLADTFGITFDSLLTITNMPIGRFREDLAEDGALERYLDLLVQNFNADNVEKVMCRNQVNVDWQGRIYDCDFNQVLNLSAGRYIGDVGAADLVGAAVPLGEHCFACTAGTGSSCHGSLSN